MLQTIFRLFYIAANGVNRNYSEVYDFGQQFCFRSESEDLLLTNAGDWQLAYE